MATPRVIGESRRPVPERRPPAETTPHEWLSSDSLGRYSELKRRGGVFPMYLSDSAEHRIREQAVEVAQSRLEVMGLLLGEVNTWQGILHSVVRAVGTTDLRNSPAKVKFDPEALPKLFLELDGAGFDYVVVGWYHSHPGHTCFLSRTDLETQRRMFSSPYHCAVVIDPLNEEIAAFRLDGDGYAEVPFALFESRSRRARRLKMPCEASDA